MVSGVLLDIPSTALSSDISITIEVIDTYLEENKYEFTLDQANNVVIAETYHFSDFMILADRDILVDRGSDARERGPGLCTKLKAKTGWAEIYERAVNGTDDYGFKALPAGRADAYTGYDKLGVYTFFWTSSIGEEINNYWTRRISYWKADIYRQFGNSDFGYSVRCVKD